MKSQRVFKLSMFPNFFAVATAMEDGKVWVAYYEHRFDTTESVQVKVANEFTKAIQTNVSIWCSREDFTLWSY